MGAAKTGPARSVVQRVLRFQGKDYSTPADFLKVAGNFEYLEKNKIKIGLVNTHIKNPETIYDLENNFAPIDEKVVKTGRALDIERGATATIEAPLDENTTPFPPHSRTYNVAIGEGAAFLRGGPIDLIGTGAWSAASPS